MNPVAPVTKTVDLGMFAMVGVDSLVKIFLWFLEWGGFGRYLCLVWSEQSDESADYQWNSRERDDCHVYDDCDAVVDPEAW